MQDLPFSNEVPPSEHRQQQCVQQRQHEMPSLMYERNRRMDCLVASSETQQRRRNTRDQQRIAQLAKMLQMAMQHRQDILQIADTAEIKEAYEKTNYTGREVGPGSDVGVMLRRLVRG